MLLETYAKIPKATPMIAEFPVASPSNPSVRFALFETAVTMKIVMITNIIQVAAVRRVGMKEAKSR